MRSIPRYTSSIKTSPILQTSSSYINENRFNFDLFLWEMKFFIFIFFDSMESGFGSDIFDANGTDLSRQSSTFERVRMSIFLIFY